MQWLHCRRFPPSHRRTQKRLANRLMKLLISGKCWMKNSLSVKTLSKPWKLSMQFLRQCWKRQRSKKDGLILHRFQILHLQTDFTTIEGKKLLSFTLELIRKILFTNIRIQKRQSRLRLVRQEMSNACIRNLRLVIVVMYLLK